jgi:type VI secretion system protein ImpF
MPPLYNKRIATHARASLLDRLIDLEPESQQEAQPLRALPLREWRQAFFRDLEWLLNTYCPLTEAKLADRQQLTVLEYGLMDFATFFTHNPSDYARLVEAIEKTLAIYEPRLKDVKIIIEPPDEGHIHNELQVGLDARLDATLLMDKVEEPISFFIRGGQVGELKIVSE